MPNKVGFKRGTSSKTLFQIPKKKKSINTFVLYVNCFKKDYQNLQTVSKFQIFLFTYPVLQNTKHISFYLSYCTA
jgi:hypothetical protein